MWSIPISHFTRVAGHFSQASLGGVVYITINVFVMQAFVFLSGYFSKKPDRSKETSFHTFMWPYLLGIPFFYFVRQYFFGNAILHWDLPPFALWYLWALFFYRYFTKEWMKIPYILELSIVVYLLAGQVPFFSDRFGLGRVVSYFPFFVMAFYCTGDQIKKLQCLKKWQCWVLGAVLTGIIQSSSASVGILQALASTGQVSYAAAVPIIMGQNIGTCVTALISCVGTNKNAKRAAVVHLMFNVIGVAVLLTVFCIVKAIFAPVLLNKAASMAGIAVAHSVFNILCTAILLPCGGLLEKLAIRLVPDKAHAADKTVELDQRLLTTPAVALERCRVVTCEMAEVAVRALQNALRSFDHYTEALASAIREDESRCDHYEDVLGTYLVKLSAQKLGEQESEEAAELLKAIGDFERISDHAVNVLESAEELREKGLAFSDEAKRELSVLSAAVNDILMRALDAFRQQDMTAARQVEPLEQVIDDLKEQLRTRHILRMQQGQCSIEAGFVWSDLLTDLERTSDHCSNIAGCVIDAAHHDLNMHATLDAARRRDPDFREQYQRCAAKYQV